MFFINLMMSFIKKMASYFNFDLSSLNLQQMFKMFFLMVGFFIFLFLLSLV